MFTSYTESRTSDGLVDGGSKTQPADTTWINKGCPWCTSGMLAGSLGHMGLCPKVQAIEYYPDGQIKQVVFR